MFSNNLTYTCYFNSVVKRGVDGRNSRMILQHSVHVSSRCAAISFQCPQIHFRGLVDNIRPTVGIPSSSYHCLSAFVDELQVRHVNCFLFKHTDLNN